jgi:Mg-chelatase subunit ChlD
MTDEVNIDVVSPNVGGRSGDSLTESDGDPIPLLGKGGGGGQVDTETYPEVEVHVNVDTGSDEMERFEQHHFGLLEEGERTEIERFDFLGDALDLVFVFDDTGSMAAEIQGAKDGVTDLTDAIDSQDIDARYGLVSFKDHVEVDTRMTTDADLLKSSVDELSAYAGGDPPEANFDAIERALDLDLRDDAQRVFVDITDAPSHYRHDGSGFSDYTFDEVAAHLEEEDVTFISVGPDRDDRSSSLKTLAGEVGGFWTDIRGVRHGTGDNFTTVLERITSLLASTYVLGFHTCTPPGTGRDLTVEFDHPRHGSDDAVTTIRVPDHYDLPPECEEEADGIETSPGGIETDSDGADAEGLGREPDGIETDSDGADAEGLGREPDGDDESFDGLGTAESLALFMEVDSHVVTVGETVHVTVRSTEGERVEDATVSADGVSGMTDSMGRCQLSFDGPGTRTLVATHPDADADETLTVEVEPTSEEDLTSAGDEGLAVSDDPVPLILEPESWSVPAGSSVKFTVRDIDGNRVPGAVVETASEMVETGDRGTCRLTIRGSGTVTVSAHTPEEGYEPDAVEVELRD